MGAETEAMLLELRRTRPYWGPRRLVFELGKRGVGPLPSPSGVYRALLRAGMIDPAARDRRSRKWKRWEQGRPIPLHPRPTPPTNRELGAGVLTGLGWGRGAQC
jgi:hypothetical protein